MQTFHTVRNQELMGETHKGLYDLLSEDQLTYSQLWEFSLNMCHKGIPIENKAIPCDVTAKKCVN